MLALGIGGLFEGGLIVKTFQQRVGNWNCFQPFPPHLGRTPYTRTVRRGRVLTNLILDGNDKIVGMLKRDANSLGLRDMYMSLRVCIYVGFCIFVFAFVWHGC